MLCIPQSSSISVVYVEVYMLDFDKMINYYVTSKKGLYRLYIHLGDTRNREKYGDFITYARRAEEIFSGSPYFESKIYSQVKRYWNKIQKRLNND